MSSGSRLHRRLDPTAAGGFRHVACTYVMTGGIANTRNSPRSFVGDMRPVGIICCRPLIVCDRIAAIWMFDIGSPYSSTTRPRMTLPRGREKSMRSTVRPARSACAFRAGPSVRRSCVTYCLFSRHLVAALGEILELVRAGGISRDGVFRLAAAQLDCNQSHLRLAERLARVGGDDLPADDRGRGRRCSRSQAGPRPGRGARRWQRNDLRVDDGGGPEESADENVRSALAPSACGLQKLARRGHLQIERLLVVVRDENMTARSRTRARNAGSVHSPGSTSELQSRGSNPGGMRIWKSSSVPGATSPRGATAASTGPSPAENDHPSVAVRLSIGAEGRARELASQGCHRDDEFESVAFGGMSMPLSVTSLPSA